MSAAFYILTVVTLILLAVSMVLSSMASAYATSNSKKSHDYAMYAAIINGLAVPIIIIAAVLYYNSGRVLSSIHSNLGDIHARLGGYIAAPSGGGVGYSG